MAIIGNKEYYKGISEIKFEGKESDNPLAFMVKEAIRLDQELKVLLGIKLQILFKRPKIKLMLLLNSLVKWDSIISVFMTTI